MDSVVTPPLLLHSQVECRNWALTKSVRVDLIVLIVTINAGGESIPVIIGEYVFRYPIYPIARSDVIRVPLTR